MVVAELHCSRFASINVAMAVCTAAGSALGTLMMIERLTSGATIVDDDAVFDTVGDRVPPGAEVVVDAVGELDGDARFEDVPDG